jgi:hypothetical protein
MLTEQPKGQLQSDHEGEKQTHTKYKDKAIYNIWVMMTAIKIIIIITKSKLSIRSDNNNTNKVKLLFRSEKVMYVHLQRIQQM